MSIEIHTGSKNLRHLEGSFDDMQEATDFIFKLINEGHKPSFIWVYATNSGVLITAKKLFRGFI